MHVCKSIPRSGFDQNCEKYGFAVAELWAAAVTLCGGAFKPRVLMGLMLFVALVSFGF